MFQSGRRWIVAVVVGLYLYYLLPATAALFYELYHLTQFGPIYWGYTAFKAGGYYFGIWDYQLLCCVLVALAIGLLPAAFNRGKQDEQA